jgi:two-component system response regulator
MSSVLVVEDDPDHRALLHVALGKSSPRLRVESVQDGVEALDYLWCRGSYADRGPDLLPRLVLLDINLPRLSGLEVLRQLRGEPRTRRLPVVLLSSSREPSDRAAGYDLGANSYVCKPSSFRDLVALVRQVSDYWLVINEPPPA